MRNLLFNGKTPRMLSLYRCLYEYNADPSCICFMRTDIESRALNSVNLLPSMTRAIQTRYPVGRKGRTSRYFTFFAEFYDVAVRCKNQYREFVCTWQQSIGAKGFANRNFQLEKGIATSPQFLPQFLSCITDCKVFFKYLDKKFFISQH